MLFWLPLAECLLATLIFAAAMAIDLDSIRTEMANDCFLISLFLIACPCLAFWPVLLTPIDWVTSSWFVVYVLAPFCAGGFGSMWCFGFWLNVFVTKCMSNQRDPSEIFLGASFLVGFGVYLGHVIYFRSLFDTAEEVDREPLVTYSCTWPCQAFFWSISVTLVVALAALIVDIVRNWRHVWRNGFYWRIPMSLLMVTDAVGWPLLLDANGLADSSCWHYYILTPLIGGLSWAGIVAILIQHAPNNRLEILRDEWHLTVVASTCGALANFWFLWVFRHSADPVIESFWAQWVFWEVVVLGLAGGLLAMYIKVYSIQQDVRWWVRTMCVCGWPTTLANGALSSGMVSALAVVSLSAGYVGFAYRAIRLLIDTLDAVDGALWHGCKKQLVLSLAGATAGAIGIGIAMANVAVATSDAPSVLVDLAWLALFALGTGGTAEAGGGNPGGAAGGGSPGGAAAGLGVGAAVELCAGSTCTQLVTDAAWL